MHVRVRFWPIAVFAIASVLSVYGARPASAGSGGEDAGTLQSFLTNLVCPTLGVPAANCPQYPTLATSPLTELVLEIAALLDAPPEAIRYGQNIPPGAAVNAGNPPAVAGNTPAPNNPPLVAEVLPDLAPVNFLSGLTPLAFVGASSSRGQAAATQPYDRNANSFFYAAASFSVNGFQPDTLNLFYDYPPRTNPFFVKGQDIADISLPMVVLNSDSSERLVPTVVQIRGNGFCAGRPPCYTSEAIGDFLNTGKPQHDNPADLGISIALVFAPSPVSKTSHAVLEVQVPLLINAANDPAYVGAFNFINQAATFEADEGFMPGFLGGRSIGIAPRAALGPPASSPAAPFSASFASNITGPFSPATPIAAAFLAIALDAETLVSAPVSP
jgi:hypothetical protein